MQSCLSNLGPDWVGRFWESGGGYEYARMSGRPCIDDSLIRGGTDRLRELIQGVPPLGPYGWLGEISEFVCELAAVTDRDVIKEYCEILQLQNIVDSSAMKDQLKKLQQGPDDLMLLSKEGLVAVAREYCQERLSSKLATKKLIKLIHESAGAGTESKNQLRLWLVGRHMRLLDEQYWGTRPLPAVGFHRV